jgi:hypothetical protein
MLSTTLFHELCASAYVWGLLQAIGLQDADEAYRTARAAGHHANLALDAGLQVKG